MTGELRDGIMSAVKTVGSPAAYVSMSHRISVSLSFGVGAARTTLSEVAMHSTHSPLRYACGSFAAR